MQERAECGKAHGKGIRIGQAIEVASPRLVLRFVIKFWLKLFLSCKSLPQPTPPSSNNSESQLQAALQSVSNCSLAVGNMKIATDIYACNAST